MSLDKSFKVAVLNYSGNVGKSTLAKNLLQPRMGQCPLLLVESINEGGDATNVKGKDFAGVMIEVLANDQVIVDIGSSNIEQVFAKVERMGDVMNEFDFVVVPSVPDEKQQKDTIKTIRDLIKLGVDAEKIKVILNYVKDADDVAKTFHLVLQAIDAVGGIDYAIVHESEGFGLLANPQIRKFAEKGRDLRKEIAAAKTQQDKHELATALVSLRIVKGVDTELDEVFKTLFAKQTA